MTTIEAALRYDLERGTAALDRTLRAHHEARNALLGLLIPPIEPVEVDDALLAAVYRAAHKAGGRPRLAVADYFRVSPDIAAKRISRARQRGFLRPTAPGRLGEDATK